MRAELAKLNQNDYAAPFLGRPLSTCAGTAKQWKHEPSLTAGIIRVQKCGKKKP